MMAKSKKMVVKAKTKRKAKMTVPRSVLDKWGHNYAQLLADPCNGPLVSGVATDGGAGIVTRFRTVANISQSDVANLNAYYLAYIPACNYVVTAGVTLTDPSVSWTTPGLVDANRGPGYSFLNTQAAQIRPLSSCIKIVYTGSELNRAGIVGTGCFPLADLGAISSVDKLQAGMTNLDRMPEDFIEQIWRPNTNDGNYQDTVNVEGINEYLRNNALVVAVTLPPGTGVRMEITTVYEWQPRYGTSGVTNPLPIVHTTSTLQQVLHQLDGLGNWGYRVGVQGAKTLSSLYSGYQSLKTLGAGVSRLALTL